MMLAENDPNAGGELTMWALTELPRPASPAHAFPNGSCPGRCVPA
jgi:hypothetical protein